MVVGCGPIPIITLGQAGRRDVGNTTYTPLTMVAPRSTDSGTATSSRSEFRMATGVMLGSFSPRGAPARFAGFKEDLLEAMRRASPRVPLVVLDGPPTMDQVSDKFRGATIEDKKKVLADAMAEYQVHNTNLWDIVRPGRSSQSAARTCCPTRGCVP